MGDHGQAQEAEVALLADGSVIVSDRATGVIQHITPKGVVSTISTSRTAAFVDTIASSVELKTEEPTTPSKDGVVQNQQVVRSHVDQGLQLGAGFPGHDDPLQRHIPI